MSCLNGEIAPTIFAKLHCVRLSVPELGFGDDLDAMVQFCLERGEELRTGCFRTRADHRDWFFSASAIRRIRKTSQSVLAEKFLYPRRSRSLAKKTIALGKNLPQRRPDIV